MVMPFDLDETGAIKMLNYYYYHNYVIQQHQTRRLSKNNHFKLCEQTYKCQNLSNS